MIFGRTGGIFGRTGRIFGSWRLTTQDHFRTQLRQDSKKDLGPKLLNDHGQEDGHGPGGGGERRRGRQDNGEKERGRHDRATWGLFFRGLQKLWQVPVMGRRTLVMAMAFGAKMVPEVSPKYC